MGDPAGKDHARSPLFVSCWLLNCDVLHDFLTRKRELHFAGGTVTAPSREPVRTCHLPGEAAASGGILGIPLAAQYGFRSFPSLMHERIICDMALSYLQTLAGNCITAVVRDIDWQNADKVQGKATPPCTQATTQFMVVTTRVNLLRVLRNMMDQAGGLAFWFKNPLQMLVGVEPRHDPNMLPCILHLTEDHAQVAERERYRTLAERRFKVDFYLKCEAAVTAILERFPRDRTAGILSVRFLNLFRAAHAAFAPGAQTAVGRWAPHVATIMAWADSEGHFDGAGVTISPLPEEARVGFLKWTLRQQRLSQEDLPTDTSGLWKVLPRRLCNETGLDIYCFNWM